MKQLKIACLLVVILMLSVSLSACQEIEEPEENIITETELPETEEEIQETTPIEIMVDEEEETEETEEEIQGIYYNVEENYFELPIQGASGYGTIQLNLRGEPSTSGELVAEIDPGVAFTIIEEEGDWWLVDTGEYVGYVYHDYCMINLPDVLPSAIYKNTNSVSSIFKSSFIDIPGLTNEQLYDTYMYNERLGEEEFTMPILYCTAKKIAYAQSMAMENGETLVIYETYRPYDTQRQVVEMLTSLSEANSTVYEGLNSGSWGMTWFISTSISNHQRGFAIDTSLGKIIETEEAVSGDYIYTNIIEYEEYEMPTPMHELSSASISMAYPVSSSNDEDWRSVPLAETMNESAIALREYCTNAGLSPLASEWWHFNDLGNNGSSLSNGQYFLSDISSIVAVQSELLD